MVPNLTAYHAAFLVAAGFALVGAVAALQIHDSDAAATIVARRRRGVAVPVTSSPANGSAPSGVQPASADTGGG